MIELFILTTSYLIGNINPSILISKWFKGMDIRDHHSKNAGASNTLITFGLKWAVVVGLIDIFKGFIVVYLFIQVYELSESLSILAGLAVIVGHIYPVLFKCKGGKGTATFFGLMLGLNPFVGLIFIVIFAVSLFTFKYVAIASLIVAWLAPFYVWFYMDAQLNSIVPMFLFALLSLFKHRENIKLILSHQETSVYDVLKKKK